MKKNSSKKFLLPLFFILILSIGLLFYFGYFYRQVLVQLWPFMLLVTAGMLGGIGAYYHEQHYGDNPSNVDSQIIINANTLIMYVVFGICGAFSVPVLLEIFPISNTLKLEFLLEGSTLSKPLILCSVVVIVSFFGVKFLNKVGSSILGSIIQSRVSKVESNVEFLGDFLEQSVDMIFRSEEKRILDNLREFEDKIKEANEESREDAVKKLDGYLKELPKTFEKFSSFAEKYLGGHENADAKVGKMKYILVTPRLSYIESFFLLYETMGDRKYISDKILVDDFNDCISVLKKCKSWGLENSLDIFLYKLAYAAVVFEKFPNSNDLSKKELEVLIKENFPSEEKYLEYYEANGGDKMSKKWEQCFQT